MRISSRVTTTFSDPESHSHNASVNVLTHAFDVPYAEKILSAAGSLHHVDNTIDRRGSRALDSVEGEIPSRAATMAVIDAKDAIPEYAQASFF